MINIIEWLAWAAATHTANHEAFTAAASVVPGVGTALNMIQVASWVAL